MSPDPYVNNLLDSSLPYSIKNSVTGWINCTLHTRADERGLDLAPYPSRAVCKGEIHELILTAEMDAKPGKTVNQIAYLGFFEVGEGGILWAGDEVRINDTLVGVLAGYDLTHYPNHYNIIIKSSDTLQTGHELGFLPGSKLIISSPVK